MATALETKPVAPKHETFVDQELAKVRQRIRSLDALRSLMMLGVVTLGYLLLMASFDLAVKGADGPWATGLRLGAFGTYALVTIFFFCQLCLRLYRRINPYYAARQLEDTLPDAKNSVINWLDLKEEPLPGAIRNAVGLKAARDLKHTDAEKAVNPKSNWLVGAILAGLVLGMLVLFALSPIQFGPLLRRAFLFQGEGLPSRTEIKLLRPAGGNITVALNKRVDFLARIEGRFPNVNQPGAPRLLYRYQSADPFVAIPLDEDHDRNWATTMLPDQVQNGLWYKIAAGDAETEEYQVKVQALPLATRFEVTYHYRPYRKTADQTVVFPDKESVVPRIKGHRGTEVELVVRTNRVLREGRVEIEGNGVKNELFGDIRAKDAQAFRAKLTLERSGAFRVYFTSQDGEENSDRGNTYVIEVLDDETPRVVLTKPAKDVSLPADGTLQLEGSANDDFGIKNLTLRLKVLEGASKPALAPKVYREGKSFQFEDGTYPDKIDYLDIVALETLKTAKGEALPLKTGMVLEYWLEATDNADYPRKEGNIGRSQAYKVTILDPNPDQQKQKEERKKAEDKQKQHDKNQDQKQGQENKERLDKRKSEAEKQKEREREKEEQEKLKEKLKKDLDKLQKPLDQEKQDKEKGKIKGDDPPKAEPKPGDGSDQNKADKKDQKPGEQNQAGERKDDGKNGHGQDAAQPKDQGPKDKGQEDPNNPGEAKGPGNEKKPEAGAKGSEPKNGPKNDSAEKGSAKEGQPKEQPGQAKDEGAKKGDEKTGQGKQDGPQAGDKNPQAKGQEGAKDTATPQAKDDPKNGGQNAKAETKRGPKEQQPTQAKEKGPGDNKQTPSGECKQCDKGTGPGQGNNPATAKGSEPGTEKSDTKQGAQGGANPKDAAQPSAKNGGQGPQGASNPKDANPEQAKDPGQAKDEQGRPTAPRREPTAEELANLKEKLKRDEQAEEAFEELSRLAEKANDPKVREEAQKLLEKYAKDQPVPPMGKGSKEQDTKTKGNAKDPGDMDANKGETKKGDPKKADGVAKGDTGEEGDKAEAKSGGKFGSYGRGKGVADDPKTSGPDASFLKRGGDLQLDDLIKRVKPETREKAGFTEDQWQQFLKDVQKYNELLQREKVQAAKKPNERGTSSILSSTGPRQTDTNLNATLDPLQSGRSQPPPEFREAQRQFTSRPDPGKK